MLTTTQEGRILLNEVAYGLIQENAPDELPLYVTTRDRYLANPEKFGQPVEVEDEALGFGSAMVIETFSQTLFPVLTPILGAIVAQAALAFKKEGGKAAADWVRSLFTDSKPQPVFTQAQIEVIQKELDTIANKEARRLGLKKVQVLTVSNAIMARLALAKK